jgi:hypothetical protein
MSFLQYFDKKFAKKLDKRANTFRKIFEVLESKKKEHYLIVETGCARLQDNFSGDGMSTVLFDEFVNYHDGLVVSIDINASHCNFARSVTSKKTKVYCEDSVEFLWKYDPPMPVDLLYLDSFDINFSKPHPSMLHHLMEFCAVQNCLKEGSLVVVDDNQGKSSGKGIYIAQLLERVGYERFINGYQIGWIL